MGKGFGIWLLLAVFFTAGLQAQPLLELKGVSKASESINTESEESYPLFSPDGRLYFVRSLYKGNVGGERAGQDIWFSEKKGDNYSIPSNQLGKLNNIFNNGVVGVGEGGNVLYLNSTYSKKFDYQVGLAKTEFVDGAWTHPSRVRIKRFNPRTGFLSYFVDEKNEVLLLSYSRSSTASEDIYVSFRSKTGWEKPLPLGPGINSEGDEFSPFLSEDGRYLYFSSTGWPGKGGTDIFMSRRLDETWQNWSTPINLPEPINSSGFDAYFTITGTTAYFSSNRDGDYSDIFIASYDQIIQEQREDTLDSEEEFTDENLLAGKVSANDLEDIKGMRLLNAEGELVEELQISESGEFVLNGLDDNTKYQLQIDAKKAENLSAYIANPDGQDIYLGKSLLTGNYPFETMGRGIKPILEAEVDNLDYALNRTYFGLSNPSGDFEKLEISLLDINGNRIEKTFINEKGEFDFKKLNTDALYALNAQELRDQEGLFLFDEAGKRELSKALLKGVIFKKLSDGSIELYKDELLDNPLAAKFAFDYDRLDVVGTRVFLLDKNGKEVGSTIVNAEGLFAFAELDPEQQYSLKFEEGVDAQLPFTLYGFTEEGERIPLASDISKGKRFNGNPAFSPPPSEDQEQFKYTDADGNPPPAGTKVYVKDDNDVVIDSGYVDAQGTVTFTRLPPDVGFKLQLANTDDLSMGLSRFFITDAEGKKVEIDETGSTIGTIVTAELAEGTETFTFAEDAAPPPGTMVYVTDENDVVIDSAEVDEFGEIRFTRLPADGNYKLKLDKAIDGSMGLDRFFIIDAEGEKIGFNENGESLKEIVGVELAASTETFTFAEDAAPPAGTVVYVTDENDNIIDSATVDEFGEIRFTRLPPDGNYKLKLDKAVDMSAGLDRFFIVDAEGEKIGFNADGETVKKIVGAELAETSEKFTFEGDSGPPPGTTVYVTDENDNIIDSATVDEFGEIRFTRLPPDGNYKLKLDKAIDNSMGLDRFFITDATGEKVGFNADGTTEMTLVSKSKALRTDYYKFNYGKLPPQGSKVYLYDASGFMIDSAIVDANGGFRFKRLNSEKDYNLKVVTPDGSEFSSDYFDLVDKSGKFFKLNALVPVEDLFAEMSEEDMRLNYEMFQFDFNSLPKSGSKVYLYNDRGYKIDSTLIYGIGSFNFKKLDELKTYYIKVKDKSFKQGSASLYALLEDSKRQLNYELLGFEYRPIDNLDKTEDTQLNISEFLNIPPEEEPSSSLVGPVAYLIDPARNTRIDSTVIDKDGTFRFNNQSSTGGVIQFNDSINGSESEIYAVSSEGRSELESSEKGFKYSASMSGSDLIVVPKEQKPVEVEQPKTPTTYPPLPEAYLALSSKERYSGYDQFQFDEENVPAPGSKVYISNDEGERLQTATIYENGIFIADKITDPGNYFISTNDPNFSNESGRLHNLTSEGRVEMKKDGDGYIYTVKQGIIEEKIDQERSNFVLATTSELTGEQSVFLYDLDEKRYADTLMLSEDGSFVIDNLDRTKTYRVEFDSAIETQDAQLFAIIGDEKDEIEKEYGEFILNPIDLLDAEGQQLKVSFLNAEGVPVEEPKEEIEKDENEEPFPLTPPVDDNEESIAVEESVVNNTVFENPPNREEPKVKKAVASMDYSDFRLKDGSFAEVVETRKGWNLHFDFNEFLLSQNQMDYVYEVLIPLLRENPNMTLVLEGHTDSIGSNDVNYRMSVLRISNVLYHIEMNGIEDTRITVRPKGESEPLAPNSTEEGRAINRRVEIIKTPEDQK